jgi:threonylcarbamoyladenosine tRNA methylthiotransferase MtaB
LTAFVQAKHGLRSGGRLFNFLPAAPDVHPGFQIMQTFCISTLGCKVNQYESEQIASLLRSRGLRQVEEPEGADLRIVNTCSVTIQAASKSRQTVRQTVMLPVINPNPNPDSHGQLNTVAHATQHASSSRTIVTGCWATSDALEASRLPGVNAVITHHDDVAKRLEQLISLWQGEDLHPPNTNTRRTIASNESSLEPVGDEGWIIQAGTQASKFTESNKPHASMLVNGKVARKHSNLIGTGGLPLLHEHQSSHQRGFLKIQDGCDAHCTYCIIPNLRPRVWSKPVEDVIKEAKALVGAGHGEIILSGIFLSAYGQETALRRRQSGGGALGQLIERLCAEVPGLLRVRLSSLEPGDLDDELVKVLANHEQVVPHFHLPLQSGSDAILRRMNRQYGREEYLRMIDRVGEAWDRPALTTDIIVGFPGENDGEFEGTVKVVERAKFIHVHAFSFSPRPGTAAARWKDDFVHGPVVNERIERLNEMAGKYSLVFRESFVGQSVNLLVERRAKGEIMQHGRSERYFPVYFDSDDDLTGRSVSVCIERVNQGRTFGTLL